MKLLVVADSDSYVKWGAATIDRMPESWVASLTVIRTPALPSTEQIDAALAGTSSANADVPLVDLADLAAHVARTQPDVVLLSLRGPVVRVVVRAIIATSKRRPVIASGLPGIAIPATLHALYYRSQVDLLILHSKREIRAFTELADRLGIEQEFGLATLPFLPAPKADRAPGRDIVFAAQAKVPRILPDRLKILNWLSQTARNHPDHRVVIKLRGRAGEPQTHAERYPYDTLLANMPDVPENLVVLTGSMGEHLNDAAAMVTVSSTAAIEAIALQVPALLINDFGMSASLINTVFEDSGLLKGSDDLMAGNFPMANREWLDDNYFHATTDETWVAVIEAAVARREAGSLVLRPQFRGTLGGNLRRIWDRKVALGPYDRSIDGYIAFAIGVPLRSGVRRAKALRTRVRRSLRNNSSNNTDDAGRRQLTRVP